MSVYKTIDLNRLNNKSDKFKEWYRESLNNAGYEFLLFGGALDQKPLVLTLDELQEYGIDFINKYDNGSNLGEIEQEWEYYLDTLVTPIIF